MKKILFLLVMPVLALQAQVRNAPISISALESQNREAFFNGVPVKSDPDTLFHPSIILPCGSSSDSLVVYTLSQTDWLFGCNSYGDTEGAQVYDAGQVYYNISSVICWIQKMGSAGNLFAKVYKVDPVTNKPTDLLATSLPLANSSLPINPGIIQKATLSFAENVSVTGKFAVSVQWFCQFSQGSACGLASTRNGCTVDTQKRSWIKSSSGSWISSQTYTDQSGNPLYTDLVILPVVYQSQVGIQDHNETELRAYYDAAERKIILCTPVENLNYELYKSDHVLVKKGNLCVLDHNVIEASGLSSGIYILHVFNEEYQNAVKLFIQ